MKLPILCLISLSFFAFNASAQIFAPFLPGSDYACITFSTGKVEVGKASPDGYSPVSAANAKNVLNGRISAARSRLNRLMELKEKVASGPALPPIEMKQLAGKFVKFINGSKQGTNDKDPDETVLRTRAEQLELIDLYIKQIKSAEKVAAFEAKAVVLCFQKKPIPLSGDFAPDIVANSDGVAVVLWAKNPGLQPFIQYCVSGAGIGTELIGASVDPCAAAEFSCPREGYMGIEIAGASGQGDLTKDEQAADVAEFMEEFVGGYHVDAQKFVDGQFVPCE